MSKKWKPEKGDTFWWFDCDGRVFPLTYHEDCSDFKFMAFGNMFKTEEKAKYAVEKIKALLLSLQEQPTECNQLPKLTAEVFDRPNCPEWAKYAVVDADGVGFYYENKPCVCEADGEWVVDTCIVGTNRIITGDFDPTDWQNSLIERPKNKQAGSDFVEKIIKSGLIEKARSEAMKKSYKKLSNARPLGTFARDQKMYYVNFLKNKKSELAVFPEWCKVGEWVYSPCCCNPDKGTYFKVTQIDGVCIIGEENVCHVDNAVRARLRPYNAKEMKALVGKVLEDDQGCFVVKRYIKRFDMIYNDEGYPLDSEQLIKFEYTIDGNPCGVLEHLNENGEWVE